MEGDGRVAKEGNYGKGRVKGRDGRVSHGLIEGRGKRMCNGSLWKGRETKKR